MRRSHPASRSSFAQLGFLAQRPLDAVLHQIVRQRGIAHQRHGIAPQAGKLRHKRVGEGGGRLTAVGGGRTGSSLQTSQCCAGEADLLRHIRKFGIPPTAF